MSLDAEKEFDRVNWKFLLATWHKFGFGSSFINQINILYTSPKACVRSNDQTAPSFSLHRGTRQGCPLFPSLFSIFVEPLAAAIRQNKNIKGIQLKKVEHKISLHAEDVLLFLQNSETHLSQTITLTEKFNLWLFYQLYTVLSINCNFQKIPTTKLLSCLGFCVFNFSVMIIVLFSCFRFLFSH